MEDESRRQMWEMKTEGIHKRQLGHRDSRSFVWVRVVLTTYSIHTHGHTLILLGSQSRTKLPMRSKYIPIPRECEHKESVTVCHTSKVRLVHSGLMLQLEWPCSSNVRDDPSSDSEVMQRNVLIYPKVNSFLQNQFDSTLPWCCYKEQAALKKIAPVGILSLRFNGKKAFGKYIMINNSNWNSWSS